MHLETIKLASEEVRGVMGATPRWILRWGNMLIVTCALLVTVLAWFIKYPDTVQGKASFSLAEDVFLVRAMQDGAIEKWFVKDDQSVKKGDLLFTLAVEGGSLKQMPFIAPVDGRIKLLNSLAMNHPGLAKDDVVLAIMPSAEKAGKVAVTIPVGRMADIAIGQNVFISMDNYPVNEYGMLTGRVVALSPVPQNNFYKVVVSLHSLTTTRNKKPDLLFAVSGHARIIIRDRRLLQKVFNTF